jgi:hypothetical protein
MQPLRRHRNQLRPIPAARHSSHATFIHKDLEDAAHFNYLRTPYAILWTPIQWAA